VVYHNGFRLVVGIGRFEDGKLGEVFINTHKAGTAIDTLLKDSAVLLSVALQYGADPVALRSALSPSGPLAAVLNHIEESP
jgi:hypothetical protein